MLTQLHIRNFAIIDELELHFHAGMTVLTGETGAGKSILIDALGLILGDRADSSVIRAGSDRAEVSATFSAGGNDPVLEYLREQAIEFEEELLIRRVINRDGPSRAFINSSPVAVQTLKNLGDCLIDIHGQHAHQSLMKREMQRSLLDACADHGDKLEAVHNAWKDWSAAGRQLADLSHDADEHESRVALLQYQVNELEELAPGTDEFDTLEADYKRLANASHLLETGHSVLNQLHEDEDSLHSRLGHLIRELRDLQRLDPALASALELLDGAAIQLDEGAGELRNYLARLELDPERLSQMEKRLDALHDMARKHHVRVEELPSHLQELQAQLERMLNSRDAIESLKKQQLEALERYRTAADVLNKSRVKAAKTMSAAISREIGQLGMPDGKIVIEVTATGGDTPQAAGSDQVEFQVALNPGQPPQPLRKVASGGELSRISLAVQVVSKEEEGIPTFIFDEVDAGIGGGVAEIVGALLHGLAHNRQVFCVTHLAQVASQGDHHLKVKKSADKKTTRTTVTELDKKERVEEIARMLGGMTITEKTRATAREMLTAVTSHK
ncbi:MAG: DNA repair protein RecN [Gammaproteobacteria bacterium]